MNADPMAVATSIGRVSRGRAGLAPIDVRGAWLPLAVAAVILWFVGRVFVAPLDHDESQYVATAMLVHGALPYRDFVSLQPPLQSWFYAPLGMLPAGYIFPGMRLLTAALAIAALAILYAGQRAAAIDRRAAAATTLAMAACSSFQFSSSIVRNDMLPLVLLVAATFPAMRMADARGRDGVSPAFGCGVLLALAAATKLSYVPMIVAVGLCQIALARRIVDRRILGYGAGLAIGLVPLLVAARVAPGNFHWGVYTFARTAPYDWYATIGRAAELDTTVKLAMLARYMATSPVGVALALVAIGWWRCRAGPNRPALMLIAMCAAGLAGAAMPTPAHRQYLLPLLPPLFVLLGLMLARGRAGRGAWLALAITAALGLVPTATALARLPVAGSPLLTAQAQSAAMRWIISSTGTTGPVATLSPDRAVDSGLPLDPRFAAGPFVFRSGELLSPRHARRLNATTPDTLARDFGRHPPAAVLVGYERQVRHGDIQVDRPLEEWAVSHGYAAYALPDRVGRLYVR
ncbi:glycosyltransferase 87 family protein [Sphingomonas sp. 1P08PE]|uniref:glycosyltransferase 87 family protein n=1 Tax=Sphingomonas sp. 1P08PE TaxID=554122 RepID=UPI0039A1D291